MTGIADFTKEELKIVQESVNERYGHEIELQLADAEIRPDLSVSELTEVPTICRSECDANFIIAKTETQKYRSQFYNRGYQMLGNFSSCVITTLQAQAVHENKEDQETDKAK